MKGEIQLLPPKLVAEIEFLELSSNGCVRGASFIGLREDKAAVEVQDEAFACEQVDEIARPLAA
ncbi:MAG: hypothetical protein E5V79_05345 [Mesorhizobium sp.]|nr:MAG: hypothetical protein E5V79_05345 [Mesorhizobium sp.]